jgi:hypothetical protein
MPGLVEDFIFKSNLLLDLLRKSVPLTAEEERQIRSIVAAIKTELDAWKERGDKWKSS